jgi:hypothetical protein
MSVLADRLLAIHRALDRAELPHAYGGAIALAYCTEEPRGTRDLDINVFVQPEESRRVLSSLPEGVQVGDDDVEAATTNGQVRVWWDDTPIDLFFDTHAYHRHAALGVRTVPFESADIPVLDCDALTVFKAFFNRTRHWADIEAMAEAGALDGGDAAAWVRHLLGADSAPAVRLQQILTKRRAKPTGEESS